MTDENPECQSLAYDTQRLGFVENEDSRVLALFVEAPEIDLQRIVVVRYVDIRKGYRAPVDGILKFSKSGESLAETNIVRLITPKSFREEGYEPGIADDFDAALKGDMAPYVASYVSRTGSFLSANDISVSTKFTAENEPWVFSTSIAPTLSPGGDSLGALRREFEKSKGKDAIITAIDDPDQFAAQLGIEAALHIENGRDLKHNSFKHLIDLRFARLICGLESLPRVDTLVWVNHGPIHYEDRELVIRTHRDMPTLEALRACFTKRRQFARQSEYRFAIRAAGKTLQQVIDLDVSNELLRLTRVLEDE